MRGAERGEERSCGKEKGRWDKGRRGSTKKEKSKVQNKGTGEMGMEGGERRRERGKEESKTER